MRKTMNVACDTKFINVNGKLTSVKNNALPY